jgi:hypothetical protein
VLHRRQQVHHRVLPVFMHSRGGGAIRVGLKGRERESEAWHHLRV